MDEKRLEEFKNKWKQISESEETPFVIQIDGDKKSFDRGWRLAINRMLNDLNRPKETITITANDVGILEL